MVLLSLSTSKADNSAVTSGIVPLPLTRPPPMPEQPIGRYTVVVPPERRSNVARIFLITIAITLTFITGWASGIYTWHEWGHRQTQTPHPPGITNSSIDGTVPFQELPPLPSHYTEMHLMPEASEYEEIRQLLRSKILETSFVLNEEQEPDALDRLFKDNTYKLRLSTQAQLASPSSARPMFATLRGQVAYWRPVRFDQAGRQRFIEQWSIWRSVPVDGLIIDLRFFRDGNNYEGAAALVSLFTPPGRPLFSLEGMNFPQQVFRSEWQPLELTPDLPVVVLVNRGTRGAAEAVSYLLKKQVAALVIGDLTAGEAGIYTETQLKSGRFLRIATGRLTMADGSVLLGIPVRPDLAVPVNSQEELRLFLTAQLSGIDAVLQLPDIPKRRADEEVNPDPLLDDAQVELPPVDERLLIAAETIQSIAIMRQSNTGVARN